MFGCISHYVTTLRTRPHYIKTSVYYVSDITRLYTIRQSGSHNASSDFPSDRISWLKWFNKYKYSLMTFLVYILAKKPVHGLLPFCNFQNHASLISTIVEVYALVSGIWSSIHIVCLKMRWVIEGNQWFYTVSKLKR